MRFSPARRKLTANQRVFSTDPRAYRSGLEEKIADQFREAGIKFRFEEVRLAYTQPAKERHYTPDFVLPNGIIVETKGLFTTEDRQKMILVRTQHPDLDIRLVFSNAQAKIAKGSKTTYAMWAEKNGYLWAHKQVPSAWLTEPPNLRSVRAIREAAEGG